MPMGNTLKLEDLLKPDCLPDEVCRRGELAYLAWGVP